MDMDVMTNIANGVYKNKVEIVRKPPTPALLRKPAGQLTAIEIANLDTVGKAYEAGVKANRESTTQFRFESGKLSQQFRNDIENEFGLTQHPKRNKLWELAYEYGHGNGLTEIYHHYSELAELIK